MNVYMTAHFRILKKQADGSYQAISKDELCYLSVGGFEFEIDGKAIPFDWDAQATSEKDNVFEYNSGYGPFFNDHEISVVYENQLDEYGVTRKDLTASFLAGASMIREFHVYIDDHEREDISFGAIEENAKNHLLYHVELIDISFEDDTSEDDAEPHMVAEAVIAAYNKGGVTYG